MQLTLRITDGPTAQAPVRVDLNGEQGILLGDRSAFDLGAPDISALGVAGVVGPRTITIPLIITGSEQAVSDALSRVASALSRPGAFLLYQRAKGDPNWFKILEPVKGTISRKWVHQTSDGSAWAWTLQLVAEGCALQQMRTLYSGSLTYNDAGLSLALPTPQGDMPAPARITLQPSNAWSWASPLVAMTAVDTGSTITTTPYATAAMFSSPSPSNLQQNAHANDFGGGEQWISTTSPMGFNPNVAVPPGRYRMYARVGVPGNGGLQYRLGVAFGRPGAPFGFEITWGDWNSWPVGMWSDGRAWLDLGAMSFPLGVPVDPQDPDSWNASAQPLYLDSRAPFNNAGANRPVECYGILYVPEQLARGSGSTLMVLDFSNSAPSNSFRAVIDSERRRVYINNIVDGKVWNAMPPCVGGGYPFLVPRQRNILTLLQGTGNKTQDTWGATCAVTVEYQPRVLQPS